MKYHVPSVFLATRILKLLSRYKYKASSLTEITELTQMNKTTCLRVLRTLQQEDFVKYNPETKKYGLGPYLIPLGNRAKELNDSVSSAIAEMTTVAAETGSTAVLIERLPEDRFIFIASEEAHRQEVKISISVSVGQQFPVAGAGIGRCFLAYDSESVWRKLLEDGLTQYTPATIVDEDAFVENLRGIRQQGYAVSHGELTPGISAVAAPIFNKAGDVELVLACLATSSQFHRDYERKVVSVLLEKTKKLSEWNGFHGFSS